MNWKNVAVIGFALLTSGCWASISGPIVIEGDTEDSGDTADTGDSGVDSGDTDCSSVERRLRDADGDGYGDPNNYVEVGVCEPWTEGYVQWIEGRDDCDDSDPDINPGADEICNDVDDDCDGSVDDWAWEADGTVAYPDADSDGYGDSTSSGEIACPGDHTAGYVANNTDCDDSDEDVNPAADEDCDNGLDDDCDGDVDSADDECDQPVDHDLDNDGYTGSQFGGPDCNDSNANVHPGANENCGNGVDDDCDGDVDSEDSECETPVESDVEIVVGFGSSYNSLELGGISYDSDVNEVTSEWICDEDALDDGICDPEDSLGYDENTDEVSGTMGIPTGEGWLKIQVRMIIGPSMTYAAFNDECTEIGWAPNSLTIDGVNIPESDLLLLSHSGNLVPSCDEGGDVWVELVDSDGDGVNFLFDADDSDDEVY